MSYQVIARKWRPQTFEEVTGQEAITQTLRNAIEHDRLHHAYLFSGARGVGKTTTARLLAKSLNCHKTAGPNPNPCSFNSSDACVSCTEIAESRSIDVLEFDAASHTKVEEIRDIILESINVNPARDRFKIFIIDEVHMLSTSSFNALLKTLEEPPPKVAFIMATTELHKVPDTILSRCQEFEFRTIPLGKIFDRLKEIAKAENVDVSDEALREIARSGEGSMRDAQSNFDQVISFSGQRIEVEDVTKALGMASSDSLTRVIEAIEKHDASDVLEVVDDLISRGHDLRNYCRDLLSLVRDLLVAKTTGDSEKLLEGAIVSKEQLSELSDGFSSQDLLRIFNSLADTELRLREATQSRHVLEMGLVKLTEMKRLSSIESILERLHALEKSLSQGSQSSSGPSDSEGLEKKNLNTLPIERPELTPPPHETISSTQAPSGEPPEASVPVASVPEEAPFVDTLDEDNDFDPDATFAERIRASVLENAWIKVAPISSEDLQHFTEDKLDEAFRVRLSREGDTLLPIANASTVVQPLIKSQRIGSEEGDGLVVEQSRRSTIELNVPDININAGPVRVLSENPTEDELRLFAESHPDIQKVLKVFRAKVVDVKRN
jgi:DNA polymerase-3 subunit gamma/tau